MAKYGQKDKVKELLITKTAIKTLTSESIVEKIVSFQGKDASRSVKSNNQIEYSGFGKFFVSQNKLRRKIANLERLREKLETSTTIQQREDKIKLTEENLEILKTKLEDETKRSNRRVEKQANSTRGAEGEDQGSTDGEDGDMQEMYI